ncbi:MAG: hypothetical protein RLO52_18090 [Sandaracinaceae bacterium]
MRGMGLMLVAVVASSACVGAGAGGVSPYPGYRPAERATGEVTVLSVHRVDFTGANELVVRGCGALGDELLVLRFDDALLHQAAAIPDSEQLGCPVVTVRVTAWTGVGPIRGELLSVLPADLFLSD